jgi:type I restriction enzyme S subunit
MKMSVLPKDWKLVNFSDLTEERLIGLVRGSKEQHELKEFNYIKMDSILKDGGLNLNLATRVDANQNEVDRYSLKKGDFLFNTRNSYELVGKTAVFDFDEENWLYNNNIMRVRFKEDVNPYFMNLAFHSPIVLKQLDAAKNKTTSVCAIYDYQLKNIKIPLPPIAEQKRIAAILDKADVIRRKRQEAIKLTEELGRSLFLDMFGDPVTNPKRWETVILGDILSVVSGQVDPKTEPYIDMPHIVGENLESNTNNIKNVKTPRTLNLKSGKYIFEVGDVLYSKIRPYLNQVVIPDFRGVCSADIYPLRVNTEKTNNNFLVYLLRSRFFLDYAEKHSTRTNIPKINRPTLLNFSFPCPPIDKQNQFSSRCEKVSQLIKKAQIQSKESENLFNSLLQRAFKGEL